MPERRHKFRRLKERVASTDVSVARKVLSEHDLDLDGSSSSWTLEALETARSTDLTASFSAFSKEIDPYIHSLPLILHNLTRILDALERTLGASDTSQDAKLTLLKLVPVIAKDVREELLPHIDRLLDAVVGQIVEDDLDLCAEAFRALGGLLTELDLDLDSLRDYMAQLLGHRRDFVRKFAADAFAPVLRRLPPKQLANQVKRVICRFAAGPDAPSRYEKQQEEIVDGAAQLMFATIRNVQRKLHSRAPEVLDALLSTLFTTSDDEVLAQRNACVKRTLDLVLYYSDKESCLPVWEAFKRVAANVAASASISTSPETDDQAATAPISAGKKKTPTKSAKRKRAKAADAEPAKAKATTPKGKAKKPKRYAPANLARFCGIVTVAMRFKRYRCAHPDVAADVLASLLAAPTKSLWDLRDDEHRVDILDAMLDLTLVIGDRAPTGSAAQRILLQYACIADLPRLVETAVRFPHAENALERLTRDLDNRFEATEEKETIVQVAAMVASPERDWLKATPSGILVYCAEHLREDQDTIRAMQLAAPGKANDVMVKALVEFVKSESVDPDARNLAIELLALNADWTRSREPRRDLLQHMLGNLHEVIADPTSLLTFSNLVELECDNLSDTQKQAVLDQHRTQLINNLAHPSHKLRLGSIKLLRDLWPEEQFLTRPDDEVDDDTQQPRCDILDKMAKLEAMPVTFDNERSRQHVMLDLERLVRLQRVPSSFHAPIASFYLGQFSVKYSPLWKWVSKAILSFAEDSDRFHNVFWPYLWMHIQRLSCDRADHEFEIDSNPASNFGSTSTMQVFTTTMEACVPIASKLESHAIVLVPLFFRFLRDEYYTAEGRDDLDQPASDEAENAFLDAMDPSDAPPAVSPGTSRGLTTGKLVAWLRVLSAFTKFRPHPRTDVLRSIFERLLLKIDTHVQELCLQGLCHMRLPCMHGHQETLEKLIKEDTFRDTITIFKIQEIDPAQRPGLLPILYRVLFARLLIRKRSVNINSRRAAIFAFFTAIDSTEEIKPLFDILFRVFPSIEAGVFDAFENPKVAMEATKVADIAVERLAGFVNTLKQVVNQLGHLCLPFFDNILCVLFAIMQFAQDTDNNRVKDLRSAAMKRLTQLFRAFPNHEFGKHWAPIFGSLMEPTITLFPSTMLNATSPPNALMMMDAITSGANGAISTTHIDWALRLAAPEFVPQTIRCLSAGVADNRGPEKPVLYMVYDVLDRLVVYPDLVRPHITLLLDTLHVRLERRYLSLRALQILTKVAGLVDDSHKHQCTKLVDLLSNFLHFASASRTWDKSVFDDVDEPDKTVDGKPSKKSGPKKKLTKDGDDDSSVEDDEGAKDGKSDDEGDASEDDVKGKEDDDDDEKDEEEGEDSETEEGVNEPLTSTSAPTHIVPIHVGRVRPREQITHDARAPLLTTITDLLRIAPAGNYAEKLAPLFGVVNIDPLYDIETRRQLVQAFSMLKGPAQLVGLNAWEGKRVNLHDFDARLTAYESLVESEELHPAVIHHALFDLIETEYPLRSAASNYLVKVVLTKCSDAVLDEVVLPALRASLKLPHPLPRKSVVHVLGQAIALRKTPYQDMRALMHADDLETDFFHGIVHVQTHRQALALKNLREALQEKRLELSEASLLDVVLPLVLHIILESTPAKYDAMEKEDVHMLQEMARHLSWPYYSGLLRHLLNLIKLFHKGPVPIEKRALNAACAVVDVFHFDAEDDKVRNVLQFQILHMLETRLSEGNDIRIHVAVAIVKVLNRLPAKVRALNLPRLLRKICDVMRSTKLPARNEARQTLIAVTTELGPDHLATVIDTLRDTLNEGYKLHIRGYSLHALLSGVEPMLRGRVDRLLSKIMSIVEQELFGSLARQKQTESEYQSRIRNLVEARVSKAPDLVELLARNIAFLPSRSIHKILSPFLERIDTSTDVKELRTAEEGLRRVQLGITQNEGVDVAQLLVYVHHLISMQGKGAVRLDGGKARSGRSNDDASRNAELDGVDVGVEEERDDSEDEDNEAEEKAENDGVKRKVSLASWLVNESREAQRNALETSRPRAKGYAGIHMIEAAPKMTGRDRFENVRSRQPLTATKKANRHIVVDHALDILLGAFRVKRLTRDNEEHRGMLDPFVDLLDDLCTSAAASRTTVLALRVLTHALPWELPRMRAKIGRITRHIMNLLQRIGFSTAKGGGSAHSVAADVNSTASDVTQEAMRMLGLTLRTCEYYEMPEDHLKLLILLAQHNMGVTQRQQTTLNLLRAIVDRRLVVPEVYDLMKTLAEMVFTAENASVRHVSTRILVAFFVYYPLSNKRLRQHLDLLVANLDFELEAGRQSGLEMLRAILAKFPHEVLDEIASFLFLSLVQRLVNEDSSACRAIVAEVLKRLFNKVSGQPASTLLDLMETWLTQDGELLLKRAAAQLVGIVAETEVGRSMARKRAEELFETLVAILDSDRATADAKGGWREAFADAAEEDEDHWLTTYYALMSLQKLCASVRALGEAKAIGLYENGLLGALVEHHPHRWVKLAALRMLGQVLDTDSDKAQSRTMDEVFTLAQAQVKVVNDESLETQMAEQLTKNLVWAFTFFTTRALAESEDEKSADAFEKLTWLVRRLSFTARYKGGSDDRGRADLRQLVAFRLFAMAATQLGEKLEPLLVPMLQPLVRVSEQPAEHGKTYEAPQLARDVLELLEQIMGAQTYLRAFTSVQTSIETTRRDRKSARAAERVQDPISFQRKRQQKSKASRESKKRKISAMRKRQGR
ncbi:Small subunit processome component 20-like [Hondaea fermentalgiana]|uniref:Small subunit processome component 20-like n=1 Tax=Hondaea fermentalgiana TaxID=2315210 RepID=A0A2R5GNP6_9STRA|nr:Small subunit processome component 20-like [Hondaea fermentalgiana]|eukprot:GBG32245.1 Small subunit processome component 20-like [Hondaea fermentalgiana]